MDMIAEALQGWNDPHGACPYLMSSNSSDAWHIGKWLNATGRTMPRDVRKSRGYTFHANDMKVRISYAKGETRIERIS